MAKSDGDLFNFSTIELKEENQKPSPAVVAAMKATEAATARLEFVKSFEDKVFAIYNKYDKTTCSAYRQTKCITQFTQFLSNLLYTLNSAILKILNNN
jgi:hypothetical protein